MALTCSAVAVAMVVGLVIAAPQARAGEWMQVSCVNPNGSAAPSDGWSSFTTGGARSRLEQQHTLHAASTDDGQPE